MGTEYGVPIVGGGTAGAAMALRLSESTGHRVLLVEAGVTFRRAASPPTSRMPFRRRR